MEPTIRVPEATTMSNLQSQLIAASRELREIRAWQNTIAKAQIKKAKASGRSVTTSAKK